MKRWSSRGLAVFLALVMAAMSVLPALASNPHEDPALAQPVYDGVSLFDYYTRTLDSVISLEPAMTEMLLAKMPLANLLPAAVGLASDITSSATRLGRLAVETDKDLQGLRALVEESQIVEMEPLIGRLIAEFTAASDNISVLRRAMDFTGDVYGARRSSAMWPYYLAAMARIDRIEAMFSLYWRLFNNLLIGIVPFELLATKDVKTIGQALQQAAARRRKTTLTLELTPDTAYVGDTVTVTGILNSIQDGRLMGRKVEIVVDGVSVATATTDVNGWYNADIEVPYRYVSGMVVRAAFFCEGSDDGVYVSAMSAPAALKVLYYAGRLVLSLPAKAYPGLAATISGSLRYADATPPRERSVGLSLDNAPIAEVTAVDGFSCQYSVPADSAVGTYVLSASVPADGRYAPVVAAAPLAVGRAEPVLALTPPGLLIVPGTLKLGGSISSELGPVSGARVQLSLPGRASFAQTAADGSFYIELGVPVGLSLIGTQAVRLWVPASAPWYESGIFPARIFIVNIVGCSAFGAALVVLGLMSGRVLSRRRILRRIRRRRPGRGEAPFPQPTLPAGTAASIPRVLSVDAGGDDTPRGRIIGWYVLLVRLVQRVARLVFKPDQTLREFGQEVERLLGPAGRHFHELTLMVERILYSRHTVTDEEVRRSESLTQQIRSGLKE